MGNRNTIQIKTMLEAIDKDDGNVPNPADWYTVGGGTSSAEKQKEKFQMDGKMEEYEIIMLY